MSKILILSGPVQSGKTTALMNFISDKKSIDGFVCPDFNGQRMMYFPSENRLMEFQIQTTDSSINIGKFSFDEIIFNKACDLIRNSIQSESDYFIIDEVGPFELKKQGYYSSISSVIEDWKNQEAKTILLVVREHLVKDVVDLFSLDNVEVVTKDDFISSSEKNNINGLILSGGNSTRMGTDKFLLKYDGVEQYKRLNEFFNNLSLDSYLSCNHEQYQNDELLINKIVDNNAFQDAGPLTGILSAYEQLKTDMLIAGCDYPYLTIEHFRMLLQFSQYGFKQIGFVKENNPDIVEPLIAFLSKDTLHDLTLFYNNGGRSLNKFLQSVNALKIQLNNDSFLQSFDTPNDYQSYMKN